ncbi:MAG: hypothetical protein ACRCX2_38535 [Paraclostridium sp.]
MKYREFLAKYGVLVTSNKDWELIRDGLQDAGYLMVDKRTPRWLNMPRDIKVVLPVSMENWVHILCAKDEEHLDYIHIATIPRDVVNAGYATAPEFAEFMKKYDEIHNLEEY